MDFTNPGLLSVRKLLLTEKDRLSTVGTLTFPKESGNDEEIVWKVSCYFDFNTVAEHVILEQLNEMLDWCPHFVKSYGLVELPVHPRVREHPRSSLPFNVELLKKETPKKGKKPKKKGGVCGEPSPGKGKILHEPNGSTDANEKTGGGPKWCKNDFIFQEYVDCPRGSVRNYFDTAKTISNGTIYSIMQQVSMALIFSQDYCNFTHYDLHSDNVLLRSTQYPHKLYITQDGKALYLKTFEIEPVIIDTGYSYSSALEGKPLDICTHNIHLGYTTHTSDPHYDLRMWLLNVIEDHPNEDKENASKLEGYFKKFKEVYRKHHMTSHGWFRSERDMDGINCHLSEVIERSAPTRSILRTKTSDTLLCVGHLLTLPLQPNAEHDSETEAQSEKEFKRLWGIISKAFWTCENKLGGVNIRMYFWKNVINYAREGNKEEFKRKCLEFLSQYSIKITESSVDFGGLYDSLYLFADRYKTLLLEYYERIDSVRQKENSFTKSPLEIIKLMEYVYRSSHKIGGGEIIRVHSMKHRKSFDLILTKEQLVKANEMNANHRAEFLLEIVGDC